MRERNGLSVRERERESMRERNGLSVREREHMKIASA